MPQTPAATAPETLPDTWLHPQALHAAWVDLQSKHRKQEFDQPALLEFAADALARCVMLSSRLRAGLWRQQPLRHWEMAKPSGVRILRVPVVEDRIVQAALAHWLAEHTETWLTPACHAYRPGRGVQSAHRAAALARAQGLPWVLKADIQDFFDSVNQGLVVNLLRERGLWAHRRAHVLRQALRAEVDAPGGPYCILRGLAQGSPLSPVLSNVALTPFDAAFAEGPAVLVRYADDFLLLAATPVELQSAMERAVETLDHLGLRLNPDKTRWHQPEEIVPFLGSSLNAVHPNAASVNNAAMDPQEGAGDNPHDPAATPSAQQPPVSPHAPAQASVQDEQASAEPASPLLRTLYLLTDGSRLARDGNTLVVECAGQPIQHLPAACISQILAFGSTSLSSGAIALCLEMSIPVMLSTARGRHFGVVDPMVVPDVALLGSQIQAAQDKPRSLAASIAIVKSKVRNSLLMLRRWQRHTPAPAGQNAITRLADAVRRVESATTLESLRGMEGAAAAAYFGAMAQWLGADWRFSRRRRQPPPDPVNSMLSYGYTILYYNLLTLVLARGLHPHIGLLHQARSGHHALVSDLMENFRPLVVDAVVMDLARNGSVKPGDFSWPAREGEPCLMNARARRTLIDAIEARFNARIALRDQDMQLDHRRLMDMQVLAMLDWLRGRVDSFLPYVAR